MLYVASTFAVQGKMRSAIGKANLLTTKKFRQFRQLCSENLVSNGSGSIDASGVKRACSLN